MQTILNEHDNNNNNTDTILQTADPSSLKWFGDLSNVIYKARCFHVYDGDTIHIIISYYNHICKHKCRLLGIDCAEMKSKDESEKARALEAKKFIIDKILDKIIYIKGSTLDKYGRSLITIYLTEEDANNDTNSINDMLLDAKLAYRYDGKTKKAFSDWNYII